jgi:hypothetical protein
MAKGYPSWNKTHGESTKGNESKEFRAWVYMIARCTNPKTKLWHRYGGRGIKVATIWLDDFRAFLANVGRAPSSEHSLDRINNDGNYEPGNVRWATKIEQANNTKRNRLFDFRGEQRTVAQWARHLGINYFTLIYRLDTLGLPFEEAISKKLRR